MPLPQLIALILALGMGDMQGQGSLGPETVWQRVLLVLGSVCALWICSTVFGLWLARSADRDTLGQTPWFWLTWARRLLDAFSLGLFAWWIFGLEWPRIVAWNLGLKDAFLLDELLVLAPFVAGQTALWVGMHRAERRVRALSGNYSLARHVLLRGRQALGVMVPLILVYGIGRDGLRWLSPSSANDPLHQLLVLAIVGVLLLLLAPAFVRLSWPTRPLEPGPLRRRLERLSERFGFQCTDILVWDTGGLLANAGITGALPWYRYVLLTDALLEQLDGLEVEAVFGHELGHVAHRHLAYFGFFFMGSIGVLALFDMAMRWSGTYSAPWLARLPDSAREVFEWGSALLVLGVYFVVVFGYLSRRFERQADVFGCRAVSCGRDSCPPHADLNASNTSVAAPEHLCPVGIQIFAGALSGVAHLNGLSFSAPSWRHGSIARRIEFLKGLGERPGAVRRFQSRVRWLRLGLGLALTAATVLAIWFGQAPQ